MLKARGVVVATLVGVLSMGVPATGIAETLIINRGQQTQGEQQGAPETSLLAGGWDVAADEATQALTDEQLAVFDEATAGLTGVSLRPVAVLASQVVAGTNWCYLVSVTPVYPGAAAHWVTAVVYVDLDGNATLTSMTDLDAGDIEIATTDTMGLAGAWAAEAPGQPAFGGDMQTVFEHAVADAEDAVFEPIALLATKDQDGDRYCKVLSLATTPGSPEGFLCVLTIEWDTLGSAGISGFERVDLNYYVTPHTGEAGQDDQAASEPVAGGSHETGGRTIVLGV